MAHVGDDERDLRETSYCAAARLFLTRASTSDAPEARRCRALAAAIAAAIKIIGEPPAFF